MKISSSLSGKAKREKYLRLGVQVILFLSALTLPVGIFHTICPMGGIATLARFFSQGLFIPKTGFINLVLLAGVLVTTLVAGAVFCGWICPLGSVQEWINALARRIKLPQAKISKRFDQVGILIRYLVLALILYMTAKSFNLVFIKADPYYALMHFYTGEVAPLALMVLGFTLVPSLFIQRPWCRWVCPLGSVLSLLGKFSILKITRPSDVCISCGACSKACPVGLDPSEQESVTSSRCIRCGLCETACPPKLRKPRRTYATVLIIALVLASLFFLAPHLSTFSDSKASTTKPSMQTTLDELEAMTGKPMAVILTLLELPKEYEVSTRLVDIEDDYEEKSWLWIENQLNRISGQ